MPADVTQADFARLFRQDTPLLDVRSPVEFSRGAFPASHNIPLLSDAEREQVGRAYHRQGGEAALALGHRLVGGEARAGLIRQWREFAEQHPQALLYCFRGGQRSHIAQQWLAESGVAVPLITGGYKALRGFLLKALEEATGSNFLVIAGKTGSGKTNLLGELPDSLDIEGAAGHRGSAFGSLTTPQPTQIHFENELAVRLLKLDHAFLPGLIVEDESRAVGSLAIPPALFNAMKQAPIALLEVDIESRVETILQDYVLANLAAWERHSPGEGESLLALSLLASLGKISRRLGGEGYQSAGKLMQKAFATGGSERLGLHRQWIRLLLEQYYDPMYEYQLSRKLPRVRFRGSRAEVLQFCRDRYRPDGYAGGASFSLESAP